jgi:DNA-binding XRE family transcriptional regulator
MTEFEKVREARRDLGLKQGEFADVVGVSQKELSVLENGGKKFLPKEYISFLHQAGFDINTLFDDNQPLKMRLPEAHFTSEPSAKYQSPSDEPLLSSMKRQFKMAKSTQYGDLLNRFDEKGENQVDFFELLIISVWEKHYLSSLQQYDRRITELEAKIKQLEKNT